MISLLLTIIIFCAAAYGLYWVCQKFSMPRPVWWICGAVLLLVLLTILLRQANLAIPPVLTR